MAHPTAVTSFSRLQALVGPVILQALQLARYQALRNTNKDIVPVDENDVIDLKPTPEEERIMATNAAVVSALEDIFSWMNKDKRKKTSQLSYIESWRLHRAVYRVWIFSTLHGYGSTRHGERVRGASFETQDAFFDKFTSQELIHISKVSRFLQFLASWVILAEVKNVGSLEVYDFNGLCLFAGPHIILRCYEEQSSNPLPSGYILDEEDCGRFLLPAVDRIISRRKVTVPLAYVGSILDEVCRIGRSCGGDGGVGLGTLATPKLYNENNWKRLKADMGLPSEIFPKLAANLHERPLFEALKKADYDVLFHELFALRGDSYKEWTRQDWLCSYCATEFFKIAVLRWWSKRPGRIGHVRQDCRHGYYCKDQCFNSGLDHAKQFNHVCGPVDENASLAHYFGRSS